MDPLCPSKTSRIWSKKKMLILLLLLLLLLLLFESFPESLLTACLPCFFKIHTCVWILFPFPFVKMCFEHSKCLNINLGTSLPFPFVGAAEPYIGPGAALHPSLPTVSVKSGMPIWEWEKVLFLSPCCFSDPPPLPWPSSLTCIIIKIEGGLCG